MARTHLPRGATRPNPGVVRARLRPPEVRALPRERLARVLAGVWDHRTTLVTGPAGSGKSTLLAQFVASCDVPVAWYRAEAADSIADLLAHLGCAFSDALEVATTDWTTVEDAAAALEVWPGDRGLLVVDDLHTLAGTAADAALERVVDYAPPWLHVVAASRRVPRWNLPRMRVSDQLFEVGPDDLRFRTWEVERLFWDFYGERLPPEDVAQLARDTDGWAAALQLLHLAIRDKPQAAQRRTVAALTNRPRLVREYLTRNVLDELPDRLHDFLLATAVLGRLSGPLCDRLLDRDDSIGVLEDLVARQLFITRLDAVDTFRYHDILRLTLESLLVERLGEARTRARFARAGSVLEEEKLLPDALRAYCRAERWDAVGRLLEQAGAALVDDPGSWLDVLPAGLVDGDPWVLLATARRYLTSGRCVVALETYRRAEGAFGRAAGAEICRREAAALAPWVQPDAVPPPDWTGVLHRAVHTGPGPAGPTTPDTVDPLLRLASGITALLRGDVQTATETMEALLDDDPPPLVAAATRICLLAAPGFLPGSPAVPGPMAVADADLQVLSPWLWRMARAVGALTGSSAGIADAAEAATRFERIGDPLGAALARYVGALGSLAAGRADAADEMVRAADSFTRLRSRTLEAWARVGHAVALHRLDDPEVATIARQAARAVNDAGLGPAAHRLLQQATRPRHRSSPTDAPPRRPVSPPITVRLLGGFTIAIGDRPVDLTVLRPRARSTLRFLALHGGRPVHVETVLDALWPGADPASAKRNLQVAVSSIRKLLDPVGDAGPDHHLQRDGDAYGLVLPAGSKSDIATFERHLAEARRLHLAGDHEPARAAAAAALDAYGGELLPEEGPAEWVVGPRRRLEIEAALAAELLAELDVARHDHAAAVAACERGLAAHRYHDPLWRLLVESRERTGDWAGAETSRREYDEVLAELGVAGRASGGSAGRSLR
jgi:DNA-binding SARP family transcriptional activator